MTSTSSSVAVMLGSERGCLASLMYLSMCVIFWALYQWLCTKQLFRW